MPYSFPLRAVIPAGGIFANALAGTPMAFFMKPGKVTVYASANVTGDTHSLTQFPGDRPGEQIIPTGAIPVASTANAAKLNENFVAQYVAEGAQVLTISGVAADVANYLFVVE